MTAVPITSTDRYDERFRTVTRPSLRLVPTPPAPPRRHRTSAATYRRRRFVAAAVLLGVLIAAGQAGRALGSGPLAAPGRRPPVEAYVVEPGDTLWDIAEVLAPERDPRAVVDALVDARGTDVVMPGETVTWLAGR